jgi:predicted transcriptional regulator
MAMHALKAEIPEPLADKLAEVAEQLHLTTDTAVSEALGNWLALQERRRLMTLEAMESVAAGQFVEDEDVRAWIDSLETDDPLPMPQPRS